MSMRFSICMGLNIIEELGLGPGKHNVIVMPQPRVAVRRKVESTYTVIITLNSFQFEKVEVEMEYMKSEENVLFHSF